MGQSFKKMVGKDAETKEKKMNDLIDKLVTEHFDGKDTGTWKDEPKFLHEIYVIIQELSENQGAMQFKIPSYEELEKVFREVGLKNDQKLSKADLKNIISKVIKPSSFSIGKGAQDILLYLYGAPMAALLLKRAIPAGSSISDEVFIPAVTSGAVYFLAKTDRL